MSDSAESHAHRMRRKKALIDAWIEATRIFAAGIKAQRGIEW